MIKGVFRERGGIVSIIEIELGKYVNFALFAASSLRISVRIMRICEKWSGAFWLDIGWQG